MIPAGFQLERLWLTGTGVSESALDFHQGLNVVQGPSNTGKTYVAQCLDFIMGASRFPKRIPEAVGYESVHLRLRARASGHVYEVRRALDGGQCWVSQRGAGGRNLHQKHRGGDTDTISHFFLSLSGLAGKNIIKNSNNEKHSLSFRDVAQLTIVDETTIIQEQSPIHSKNPIDQTKEWNAFRLFLTGRDDSAAVPRLAPKVAREREKGKAELLRDLRQNLERELDELGVGREISPILNKLRDAEAEMAAANAALEEQKVPTAEIEEKRAKSWARVRERESRMAVLRQLHARFQLLDEQYQSDIRRLASLAEAAETLSATPEESCPVCGARPEHHDHTHRAAQPIENVAAASRAEAEKTLALQRDLQTTIQATDSELAELSDSVEHDRADLTRLETEFKQNIQPRIEAALARIKNAQAGLESARSAASLASRLRELEAVGDSLGELRPQRAERTVRRSGPSELEQFCSLVEEVLESWNFPTEGRVTFDNATHDIRIGGNERNVQGKGYRAITHAAFNLALLQYCVDRNLAHPGLVILDSPLVVYKEPAERTQYEARNVKQQFYESVAERFKKFQVIVFENEEPSQSVERLAKVTRFTKASHGRYGFIER